MYRNDWHVRHHEKTRYSAEVILKILLKVLPVSSILDVGCGHGDWLRVALDLGTQEIAGCDGPWIDGNALFIPRESYRCVNLQMPLRLERRFDLTICLEVAEHLSETYALTIVKSLAHHSDVVFFGAAIPYQGGYRHVNEQWPSWWSKHFAEQGFLHFDPVRRAVWDDPSVHFWYKQNALLYVRRDRGDLIEKATELEAEVGGPLPIDIVHPEKYLSAASYGSIAFKPLLRALPGAVARKARTMFREATS
jgi:SAM-dependent methyltransferase